MRREGFGFLFLQPPLRNGQSPWFLVQRVLDRRDPHLLGPPLRPDPQSYSALSDYLLPTPIYYSYLL